MSGFQGFPNLVNHFAIPSTPVGQYPDRIKLNSRSPRYLWDEVEQAVEVGLLKRDDGEGEETEQYSLSEHGAIALSGCRSSA